MRMLDDDNTEQQDNDFGSWVEKHFARTTPKTNKMSAAMSSATVNDTLCAVERMYQRCLQEEHFFQQQRTSLTDLGLEQ